MKTYNSYHTCIKQLAKSNRIPETYLVSIDRTTIWRWKQEPKDKYLGTELTNIEILDQFLARKESETIIMSYLKVATALSRIFSASDQLHRIMKQYKTDFINAILKYKSKINLKLILRLCRIPVSVFQEIWHADIMVIKTLDGIKSYLYFLMDKYSRLIINWRAELKVSGKIRLETIEEAYHKYSPDSGEDIILLVDGGVENNNEINLRKLIAQKDIRFSNSVIEAQNKLIKYRYLFKQDFRDIHDLKKGLEWIVFDYNNNRPHISLRGLTPNEAATGENVPKDMWHEQIIQAQINRLEENRKELCRICK